MAAISKKQTFTQNPHGGLTLTVFHFIYITVWYMQKKQIRVWAKTKPS